MATRDADIRLKRSNVSGKIPTLGQLELGQVALNTADAKLYTEYTGGATGATEVREIAWNRVNITGDTMTGPLYGPTISATTIDGDTITVNGTSNLNTVTATTIDFDVTYTGGTSEGRLSWNVDDGTLDLGMAGGNVTQQIGQEVFYHILNQSGATIENGRVVKAAGTLGSSGKILGEYMIADNTVDGKFTLGIATEDILNGEEGFVTEFGLVRGIDTTGGPYSETWVDGDLIYVSATILGGLTNVEPLAPNLHIEMGIVINTNANGSLFVRPHRYPHLEDLQHMGWSGGTETNLDIVQWDTASNIWTLTNTPNFNSLSATTIDAATILSGGTNLNELFASVEGGEVNTASNLTGGTGVFAQKSIFNLEFKSLTSTGNTVNITSDTNTVNLEGVSDNTKTDVSLFNTYTGDTATELAAKALQADLVTHTGDTSNPHNVTIEQVSGVTETLFNTYTGDTETLINGKVETTLFNTYTGDTATALGTKFDTITSTGGTVTIVDGGTTVNLEAAGETNTASNLTGGTGMFAQKTGVDLEFKSLTSTGGTATITSDSTTVNIESVNPELTKSLYLSDPIATDDIGMWEPGVAITITKVVWKGIGATHTSFNINHSGGTDLWATDKNATTTRQTTTSFTDATCTAANYIRYQASAISGTPTGIEITITYTED